MRPNLRFEPTSIDYVFLDRDGVLNRKPLPGKYVTCCDELILLPGAAEAVAKLNRSGRKVVVATNQRGIALGLYSIADLERIHDKLRTELAHYKAQLDAVYVCPHDEGQCHCRKPLTGLFDQAFQEFPGASPSRSIMIGDSLRDIEAGLRAGMETALIVAADSADSEDHRRAQQMAKFTASSLLEVVDCYLCPDPE